MKEFRPRLNPEEMNVVNEFRRIKEEANESGLNDQDIKHGWIKTDKASLFFKNPNFNGSEDKQNDFTKELLKSLKDHAPTYNKIKRKRIKDGHLLVIDPADIHIGKLCTAFESGSDYNSQIAVKRVLEGVAVSYKRLTDLI